MKNIDLRIASIQDIEFYINAPTTIRPEDIGVQVEGNKIDIDSDSKMVTLFSEVTYTWKYNTIDAQLVLRYINATSFYIDNFNEVFIPEDGHYLFDSGVTRFLIDIIVHTVRGILAIKTAGTGLSSCYLPLIPADQITQSG